MREKIAAVVIGLIMIMSVAGFASFSLVGRIGDNQQQNQGPQVPAIVYKPLTGQETVYVLQTGRVIIKSHSPPTCIECSEINSILETVANRFPDFIVLEEVSTNQTVLQLVGSDGRITELDPANVTLDGMTDIFCDKALIKPKECLLRNV